MSPITTIVHFEIPSDNVDRFLAFWQDTVKGVMLEQRGVVDGVLHRGIDLDGPFQFINVARWESAEALESGLRATAEALERDGVDIARVFQDMGVKASQNNYVEEVRYSADPA